MVLGTSRGTRRAPAQTKVLAALALVLVICLFDSTSAFAAASYVFEPTLSLTGNCSTSLADEVPDPGLCPIPPGTVFSGSPGADHPSKRFEEPGVTTDAYGDVYVVSMLEAKSRIDVFAPDGTFITEFADTGGAQSIAVDSKGNVYVFERLAGGEREVRRFPPSVYEPVKGNIAYTEAPIKIVGDETEPLVLGFGQLQGASSVAVDPATDQLYVDYSQGVARFGSAEEENKLLEKEAISGLKRSTSITIDAKHNKIYLSEEILFSSVVRVFELKAPHKELKEDEIDGSATPTGKFLSTGGFLPIDVDERLGNVFVYDASAEKVYEFEEDGTYLQSIEHQLDGPPFGAIAVDDGAFSPRPQKEAWLFVPSGRVPSTGHVYAFEPNEEGPPLVESTSVGDITETEAVLHAKINPRGVATAYRLEYLSQQRFEASGFNEANIAGEGSLSAGGEGISVSAPTLELQPGTRYRFRAFAENAKGEDEEEKTFKTFPAEEEPPPCVNKAFRTALSALLPDCRAYELVTPGNTNGRPPTGGFIGIYFPTLRSSLDGNRVSFLVEGGAIPGQEAAGAFNGDPYLATRGTEGWTSEVTGPSGREASSPNPGSVSPDQTYSFWEDIEAPAVKIRYPDGDSELVGRGSLGEDPRVNARLITEDGGHIVFSTEAPSGIQLEPNAPPAGTAAIYDRAAEGPTHVVSLLPGDVTPGAGENASYLGASEDGEGIAFSIGGTIYVRLHNTETFKVAGPGSTFAGVAEEGKRVFYIEGGNLFAFNTATEATIPFSTSGDVTVVNVATGGTRAYFVSPSKLTSEPNPNGEGAKAGAENLYLSEEGAISFVGQVTKRDVEGELRPDGVVGGLGLWISGLKTSSPSIDPSRVTPAGQSLLFESRADLTEFKSEGFVQVYRYDSAQGRLTCISCSPTGIPPTSDASLQSIEPVQFAPEPAGSHMKIANQSPDGQRAFFQTAEPLVTGDTDNLLDVYEWEENEVGSCERPGGCVYLISGGHSASPDYLYAMSVSGDDVFFRTSDILLPRDLESTLSLYDARVLGGFPEPELSIPCEGEGCHSVNPAPSLPAPATAVVGGSSSAPHCPKGERKVKRHGKLVCVKKHHRKHRRRNTGTGHRGGVK